MLGLKRFVVADTSMLPTVEPGDGMIGLRSSRIRRGELRCFEHPSATDFWLVKRVGDVRRGQFEARSDRAGNDVVDSSRFGLVPIEGSYRVLVRIPQRFLR